MCIAAIINKPLSEEFLRVMDEDNPHGGGVAWLAEGDTEVSFRRGLGYRQILELQDSGQLTYPYLLHFRWATHGAVSDELTHPFPIGRRAFFGELSGKAESVMIHNGIWADYKDWLPLIEGEIPAALLKSASDTAIAAYLYERYPDLGDHMPWAVCVASVRDAKLHLVMHGHTWSDYEGNTYSNMMWLPAQKWWEHSKQGTGSKWRPRRKASAWAWEGDGDGWGDEVYVDVKEELERDPDVPQMNYDDWQDYVRARYGDEVADEIRKDAITVKASDDLEDLSDENAFGMNEMPDELDVAELEASEDFSTVNEWLAKQPAYRSERKRGAA